MAWQAARHSLRQRAANTSAEHCWRGRNATASGSHIQPGKPQQNAYVERYNRTVRYAWLARTLFDTIEQVQDKATRWLWAYNHERPNMALGGITPMQKLAVAT